MANDLSNLKITEVSFCKRGMNQHARISLFKSADNKAGSSGNQPDGEKMSDTVNKTVTDLEKSVADLTTRLAKAEADKVTAEKIAKFDDAEREFFAKADDKAKEEFLEDDDKKRKEKVTKALAADETVELNGQSIKKSAVAPEIFAILKGQSEEIAKSNERIAKAEAAAELTELRKKADLDFGKVVGSTDEKANLLKALKAVGGEVEAYGLKLLKAANETVAFDNIGKSNAEKVDVRKAFDTKVHEIAKRDNISEAQAIAKAVSEHPELVNAE